MTSVSRDAHATPWITYKDLPKNKTEKRFSEIKETKQEEINSDTFGERTSESQESCRSAEQETSLRKINLHQTNPRPSKAEICNTQFSCGKTPESGISG